MSTHSRDPYDSDDIHDDEKWVLVYFKEDRSVMNDAETWAKNKFGSLCFFRFGPKFLFKNKEDAFHFKIMWKI